MHATHLEAIQMVQKLSYRLEPGDYAIRGGIIDVFPPGESGPVRLDLFGDVLDGAMSDRLSIQAAMDSGLAVKPLGTPAFYEPLAIALDRSAALPREF